MDLYYFAYGSNMDGVQMRQRCPSSRFVARALLAEHALAFTRYSSARGCGVADIVPFAGGLVWGVVYTLTAADRKHLDTCEGYDPDRAQNAYRRVRRTVLVEGHRDTTLEAATYEVCHRADRVYLPDAAYLAHLWRGAEMWGLPESYRMTLRALPHR